MFVIKHRSFFFWLTGLLLAGAIGALAFIPPQLSIDFTGGSLVEVSYAGPHPTTEELQKALEPLNLGEVSLRESGTSGVVLRSKTLTPDEHAAVLAALSGSASSTELRYTAIGPSMGSELSAKALYAIAAVVLMIMLYIAFAFRKVSKPVPSWGYGIAVVAMLAIDIIVPAGFFAVYAKFTGAQADILFVVALLALLGYCVNDVIVIFDRIREHLRKNAELNVKEEFETTIGKSIDETMARSINTGLTVVLALIAIIAVGPEATHNFALVILVGVVAGTFSSICRSAPLLIPIAKWFAKK